MMSMELQHIGARSIFVAPNGWGIHPLKYVSYPNRYVLPEATPADYTFRYVDIGSVNETQGIYEYKEMSFEDAPSRARRLVSKGDTIISTVRTYLKAIAYIDDAENVVVSTGFCVQTPRDFMYPKFLFYYCISEGFIADVNKFSTGVSYPAISDALLGKILVLCPPIEEQAAIADYLDRECPKLDEIIETIEKQIDLLKRRRTGIINQAVTMGSAGSASTAKYSGNPYVGMIDSEAEAIRFKYVATIEADLVDPQKYLDALQVSPENIVSNTGELIDIATVDEVGVDSWNQRFFAGQIIYSKIRPALNKVAVAPFDGLCSADMYPITTILPTRYLMYYMLSDAFVRQTIDVSSIRVKMPKVNQEELKNFIVVIHKRDEMERIVRYLDKACADIDIVLSEKKRQLEIAVKQRRSLIYEYVTGQKRVKEVQQDAHQS